MRESSFPKRDFKDMNAEEIALTVEADIKSLARKWKYRYVKRTPIMENTGAIETAALYLQANHALYFRDDRQAMKDAHQEWMMIMQEWFLSTVKRKRAKE